MIYRRHDPPPKPATRKPVQLGIALSEDDLAICRGGCPEYQEIGTSGFRCWLGLDRTCDRAGVQQWIDRGMGSIPPCPRQLAARNWPPPLPESELISPANQHIIQIEITNACGSSCSNCTRLCPHVREPFFMDFDTFKAAVDSMRGYRGMLGIMGGSPCLHPEFDTLIRYYREHWHSNIPVHYDRRPIADFGAYHAEYRNRVDMPDRRGLWACVDEHFCRHYELIMDTFGYLCLNDRKNVTHHQSFLCGRKELEIPDDVWYPLRNQCWVQRCWSASMNLLGGWFCEIAGSLAMLYKDSSDAEVSALCKTGLPLEPGWWRGTPDNEFSHQLEWCEYCSMPLNMPSRMANESIQDVSPLHYRLLKGVGSPAILQNERKRDRMREAKVGALASLNTTNL